MRASPDPKAYERAEMLVRLVSDLYGAGIERMVVLAREHSPELLTHLAGDELVAGLLVLHGVHPESLRDRVEGALASVRPMLQGHEGDVELLDIDEEVGAVRLRLLGSCDGCPSSTATLQGAVERAIYDAAPEIGIIDVDEPEPPDRSVPIALGRKPTYEACPSELAVPTAIGGP